MASALIDATTVIQLLQQRGITAEMLAKDFMLTPKTVKNWYSSRRMSKNTATRILQHLAGLPRTPTRKEIENSRLEMETNRRTRQKQGLRTTPYLYGPVTEKELRDTRHLAYPKNGNLRKRLSPRLSESEMEAIRWE
jgi:hypothetical protein